MNPNIPKAEPPLGHDDVDVWLARPSDVSEQRLHSYLDLLPTDERDKCARFAFDEGRSSCLITRALVRTTLAHYFDRPPQSFIFETGEHGRPYLVPGQLDPTPSFNLSHTHGLIACALSHAGEVGVDVEWLGRNTQTQRIAHRYFSETEIGDLLALPVAEREQRFFDYWTLKEAYLKARGFGLSVPLKRFSFHLGRGSERPWSPTATFEADLEPSAKPWWFRLEALSPEHTLAVALCRRKVQHSLTLRISRTVPTA